MNDDSSPELALISNDVEGAPTPQRPPASAIGGANTADQLLGKLSSDVEHLGGRTAKLETDVSAIRDDVSELKVSVGRMEEALKNGFENVRDRFEASAKLADERHAVVKGDFAKNRWIISVIVALVGVGVALVSVFLG